MVSRRKMGVPVRGVLSLVSSWRVGDGRLLGAFCFLIKRKPLSAFRAVISQHQQRHSIGPATQRPHRSLRTKCSRQPSCRDALSAHPSSIASAQFIRHLVGSQSSLPSPAASWLAGWLAGCPSCDSSLCMHTILICVLGDSPRSGGQTEGGTA